jgi:hypothetical protein
MLVSTTKRFLFAHIYKTGGSSLTVHLSPHVAAGLRDANPRLEGRGWQATWHYRGDQHGKTSSYLPALHAEGITSRAFRLFTFVRNPYSWALSIWNNFYRRPREYSASSKAFHQANPGAGFRDLIRFLHERWATGARDYWGLSDQTSFIENDLRYEPFFIGRFERFAADALRLLAALQIPANKIAHQVNRGIEWQQARTERVMDHYDAPSVAKVNEMYERDFERFRYELLTPGAHR